MNCPKHKNVKVERHKELDGIMTNKYCPWCEGKFDLDLLLMSAEEAKVFKERKTQDFRLERAIKAYMGEK